MAWSFSVRQLELSDTAVFDQPQAGRAWFEAAIRDHLDLGRPDNVSLVFARGVRMRGKKRTPGRFSTQVVTRGTQPRIAVRYKSSGTKAYFKEATGPAGGDDHQQRRADFDLKKTLNAENWRALRRTGDQINARFLEALGENERGLPDADTLQAVVLPTVHDGQRAPGLRFGDPRTVALFGSLAPSNTSSRGLNNPSLRARHAGPLRSRLHAGSGHLRPPPAPAEGLHRAHSGHPHATASPPMARQMATFFTRLVTRVVVPTLTDLDSLSRPTRREPTPVAAAWRAYDKEVRAILRESQIAA